MEARALTTEPRSETGKGAARQLRAQNKIPAVFYGPKMEPVSLAVSPKELTSALSTEYRRNQLLELTVGGERRHAVVKELQVDPVTRVPLHVDLYSVSPDTVLDRQVPLRTQGRAPGVVAGGDLRVLYRSLPVRGPVGAIPSEIMVDIGRMNLGDVVRVKDLPMGEGVSVSLSGDRSVVSVATGRRRGGKDEKGAEEEK